MTDHPEIMACSDNPKYDEPSNPAPDWNTPWGYSWRGRCINALVEARIHLRRSLQPSKRRRLVIFPCGDQRSNPASLLRAYKLGEELRKNHRWRVTIIPPRLSLDQRQRIVALEKPDLIFMQMERHPLNRPRMYLPYPVVFDIDDADFLWEYARDAVNECCRDSIAVTAGSKYVADYASALNSDTTIIWTGGPKVSRMLGKPQSHRGNIVAWGHSHPVDYPKEAEFIQKVLLEVQKRVPVEYWIFGCDGSQGRSILAGHLEGSGVKVRFIGSLPFDKFTQQLGKAAIGVQVLAEGHDFSRGKSFGKILNYICAGVVVVASNAADHPDFFSDGMNGCLAASFEEWVDAVSGLLTDAQRRQQLAATAFDDYKRRLSIGAAAYRYNECFIRILHERHERAVR
jgi:glycosyltransferase involved in cell wall biosynthesis